MCPVVELHLNEVILTGTQCFWHVLHIIYLLNKLVCFDATLFTTETWTEQGFHCRSKCSVRNQKRNSCGPNSTPFPHDWAESRQFKYILFFFLRGSIAGKNKRYKRLRQRLAVKTSQTVLKTPDFIINHLRKTKQNICWAFCPPAGEDVHQFDQNYLQILVSCVPL